MKNILIKIMIVSIAFVCANCSADSDSGSSNEGKGGSMARFAIVGNFLYIVDYSDLHTYNIADWGKPQRVGLKNIGEGIETIYPFNGKLFIGSSTGMYAYEIKDEGAPEFLTNVQHIVSCDPVVADDKYAYVTLRGSGDCRFGSENMMQIINIENISSPYIVLEQSVTEPYGLAIDEDILFVCHGIAGVGVYDVSNRKQTRHLTTINTEAFDVICDNKTLMVTGKSGFYQYDYSDINNITFLSAINTGI